MFATAAASSFNPGLIISDYNFYNGWAMTESEIQSFLDWTVGSCRNAYCLNVYRMDTQTRSPGFGNCATYQGAPNESAARIIYKVQRACGISAKVLLVTLQKEQGLVTNDAPPLSDLRKAMGQGCPDTSDCDANYYGLMNQLYFGARQLTWYNNPEGSFTRIKVGQWNPIQLHPNADCGAPGVLVQNNATAALYYYTPYQPNAAALANMYGTGDSCSSYGNRNFWVYYNRYFGNPVTGTPTNASRIAGDDRYSTAIEISKVTYPTSGVPVAYVTTGQDFPDALSAAPAAAAQGGPLLLTYPFGVPSTTIDELRRLKPAKIVVVGGTAAVGDAAYAALQAVQGNITRISGVDRYETSRKLAAGVFPKVTSAYLATGGNFPDALSASAAAGAKKIPVVLVDGSLPIAGEPTTALLASMGVVSTKIAGGTAAVSSGIEASVKAAGFTVQRLAAGDRYGTSIAINQDAFDSATAVFVATGEAFPDALAGAAAAGKAGSPLFVTFPACMPGPLRTEANNLGMKNLTLLGGPVALSDRVAFMTVC
jgi:putative cell wall-binding protein